MDFNEFCKELETTIKNSYEEGTTLDEAEKLAAKFLFAQIQVSNHLKSADLDTRMRKSGVKAVRAAVYADTCAKHEKKPTVDALEHALNSNGLVNEQQQELDKAEVSKNELERLYDVFSNAHIYYRGIAKGRFE